jgi:hypothetical protein
MNILGVDPGTDTTDECIQRAYVAGIIDGEGYVGIKRRNPIKKAKSPRFSACVSVEMTDLSVIKTVADFCRVDHKFIRRPKRYQDHHKQRFLLCVENKRAATLLTAVLPYLIAKQDLANLAIELEHLKTSPSRRTQLSSVLTFKAGVNKGAKYKVFALSDAHVARCELLYRAALSKAPKLNAGGHFQCVS